MRDLFTYGIGNFEAISGGHVTEEKVREMIDANNQDYVNPTIDRKIEKIKDYDDVKVFNQLSLFPGCNESSVIEEIEFDGEKIRVVVPATMPTSEEVDADSLYQDRTTGIQFVWVWSKAQTDEGFYKVVSEPENIEKSDIEQMFNKIV